MQDHGNGGLQPVAYLSKVLNSAQSHYPTWEQELLALYLSLEEWRHYLLGVHCPNRSQWVKVPPDSEASEGTTMALDGILQ